MVSKYLPPGVRRVFTNAPLIGITVGLLVITALYILSAFEQGVLRLRPSSWRPGGYGYPPDVEVVPIQDPSTPNMEAPTPFVLQDLPIEYTPHFPTLQLPSDLLTSPHFHPLATRLHTFLNRPIRTYDEAMRVNEEGCPRRLNDKLVNPDQYRGELAFWEKVSVVDIVERRSQVVKWMGAWAEREGARGLAGGDGMGKGRGIVLTGGNQDTTLRLISVLKHLKRLGTNLPVEVFHYEDELHDSDQRRQIEAFGAVLKIVRGVSKEAGAWKNWQIKGLALVQSSFREILYLDSDNIPLRDPSHLFTTPLYHSSNHAIFWPDLSKDHPSNSIWRLVGEPCTNDLWTFETGQIVIDKAGNDGLNLAALIIAAEMQGDRDFWFHMSGGDKDTFRWAWRILGLDFGMAPRWMSTLGIRNDYDGGKFCGHTVLQYDLIKPEGFEKEPPLFVHSNLLKHLGSSGLGKGSLFTHVKRFHNDTITNPQLNYARSYVYMGPARGMCLDLEWHASAYEDMSEEERKENYVEEVPIGDVEGDVFKGFEEAWFDEGGRIGGW